MDSRANNTLEGTQLQRKLYQDVDVLNSVCRMQYWKKNNINTKWPQKIIETYS